MNATVSDILRVKGSVVECIAPDATILDAIGSTPMIEGWC